MKARAKSRVKDSTRSDVKDLNVLASRAMVATYTAYTRALESSSKGVLRIDNADLVRVSRDGSIAVVGKAKPRRKVNVGQVITVRRVESEASGCSA
ncbi:hypothetical protein SRABI70_00327 [Pseudomonas sp. Bi70]|nr:hypothetical protein SRABI70_00327 [Pseudomonas sp. Bi70]